MFFLIAPSAPQALKKDEGVPWTGMLAIVHSYVTHKTGKVSLGVGKDPRTHMSTGKESRPRPVPSRVFLARLLAQLPPGGSGLSFPVKEEEKQKLLQRGSELQSEHQQLEERDRQLASAVKVSTGCLITHSLNPVSPVPIG